VGTAQENPVLEFLSLLDADDFRPNLPQATALLAADATYQINVPARARLIGRDAILGELMRQAGDYTDCECEVLTVVSDDRFVITERVDHVTMIHNGLRVHNPLLAIFEINGDGLIQNWSCPTSTATSSGSPICGAARSFSRRGRRGAAAGRTCACGRPCTRSWAVRGSRSSPSHSTPGERPRPGRGSRRRRRRTRH
jgi:limonene-1,2-epoxide hydrolase